MPPKKKAQSFGWDEEKKRIVLECLARAREIGGKRDDISKELRKQFLQKYTQCQLSAASIYKYALSVEKCNIDLPGETKSSVIRWTTEKDAFLIECITRARKENQQRLALGLQAGKVGHHGQFGHLLVEFFTEKYNEHSANAIILRMQQLNKIKHIPNANEKNDQSGDVLHDKERSLGDISVNERHLPSDDLTSKECSLGDTSVNERHLPSDLLTSKGRSLGDTSVNERHLPSDILISEKHSCSDISVHERRRCSGEYSGNEDSVASDTLNNKRRLSSDGFGSKTHLTDNIIAPNLIVLFNNAMKYWEFNYKYASQAIFVGVCAICSSVCINERYPHWKLKIIPELIIFQHYNQQDVKLKVINDLAKNLCYVCSLCNNRDFLNKYRLAPNQIHSFPLPQAILDLSDDDKRQICLVALQSNVAKSSSEALRIFHHQRGDWNTQQKDEKCYFDMYAMIVNQQPVANNTMSGNTKNIVTALRWLRNNNHLYDKFAATYETLFRFVKRQPGQPTTIPVSNNVNFDPAAGNQTKTSILDSEQAALLIPAYNIPSRGINVGNTVTAVQHVRDVQTAKNEYAKLVNVFSKDIYLEAKVFPWLLPYGIGGWSNINCQGISLGTYLRWRIRMYDGRFRDDMDYMFFMLDLIIKARLQYYSSTKVNVTNLAEPLTVQKLKDAGNNPFDQYGTEVPASIPNSRNYWASKTLDLIAMSSHMGRVPDFFVTLTENDSWPELQAVIRDGLPGVHQSAESKEFEDIHKCGLPAMRYPVQTVIAFYRRLQEFRFRFLQDPSGPFGNVLDYWIRIEYQKRGSLHAHLVVWCDQNTIPHDVISAEMPRFNHPMNNRWRFIVGNYQKHTCFMDRCFKGKNGKILDKCKFGFPNNICFNMTRETNGVRYRYIRRHIEDRQIIPYNMPLILFWDGHVNVQKVTDGGWELYLAKYVAKSELPTKMRLTRKRNSECEIYLRTRVVSLLEAATLLLQYPHVLSSREVVYLPIDLNPAYRFLKRVSDLEKCQPNENLQMYYDTKVEKYLDRPDVLCNLTYPQFFARYRYTLSHRENEEIDDELAEFDDITSKINKISVNNNDPLLCDILFDKKNRRIQKRVRHEAIVRFKDYSPYGDDLERYCLTKLLQNVPIVDRAGYTALKETTGSYLEECMRRNLINEEDEAKQFLEGAAKRGISLDRLRDIASQLIEGNWLQNQDIDQLLETVAPYQMQAERVRNEPVADDDDDIVIVDRDTLDLNIRTYLPVDKYISGFTQSQHKAFEFITSLWTNNRQCLTIITGGGGVGKTFLLDGLVAFCNENHKTVQKLATTGCAAHIIGGLTIHSFLRMTTDLESHIERGSTEAFIIDNLQVLLIDEISMLEERVMMKLEESLMIHSRSNIEQNGSRRFAGKSVIMFGDPAQLPPVGRHIWQSHLLNGFEIIVLKEIVRQKDDCQFMDLLNRVRLGEPNDADIKLLQTRIVTQQQLQNIEIGDRGLMLFPTRRQKDETNAIELTKLLTNERIYLAQDIDESGSTNLSNKVRKFIAEIEEKMQLLPAKLSLKIGARVMLTRNRDVVHGWVNGTLATVVNMSDNYVVIAAVNNPQRKLITFPVQQQIHPKGMDQPIYRKQFPLDLAYGVTIHKSQGQTLDVVAVSANKLGFSGQFYTAISRVRELTGLYLIDFDPKSIFLMPDVRKLLHWMDQVDVITSRPSDWQKPKMPTVSHIMSRNDFQIVNISTDIKTIKRPLPNNAIQPQSDINVKRLCRLQLIDQILDGIHGLNTNCSSQRFLQSFDSIISSDVNISNLCTEWNGRIFQANTIVFNVGLHENFVDCILTDQTYRAISYDYGRVIKTTGDGSCLFHALSWCLFGNENYDRQLRLLCCLEFRTHSEFYATQHNRTHLDYDSIQMLIHLTAQRDGRHESWGGAAHLQAMANLAQCEIYVYTGFATDTNGLVHPQCENNRFLSIDALQVKCNNHELYGLHFTRYKPHVVFSHRYKRPLTLLFTGIGSGTHYSAILPIAENGPMVKPLVVLPPEEDNMGNIVMIDQINISE